MGDDPPAAVAAIFTWRTVHKLGVPTITSLLNADPAAYLPPDGTPADHRAGRPCAA